ncbi:N-acyl amino acid synthase FeeM domain-containing protein [Burkholderia cenocepacia]|uniref:N-acyl amino acid synthase FeeM domain-containing protein n=1 Tax=Burkholderia cenocepacia TaxID=95486 RepID=UPI00076DDF95|nr:hypothetical protein [Burkholderia cenocepacia]KWU23431.1 hypothetical protein AS149_37210 [Burkholderia cenocepacia]
MDRQTLSNTQAPQKTESLPFIIDVVSSEEGLAAAVKIRHTAYARHLPDVARGMSEAESWDFRDGTVVLVARSKLDGEPLGTMRIHTNLFAPLPLEQSVTLPSRFDGKTLGEAARLGVTAGAVGSVVKTALFKAYYLYCRRENIDHMVITARSPLDRMYERLVFTDVGEHRAFIPMKHVGDLPHRVMSLSVREAHDLWVARRHPLFGFCVETFHPDIFPGHQKTASGNPPETRETMKDAA